MTTYAPDTIRQTVHAAYLDPDDPELAAAEPVRCLACGVRWLVPWFDCCAPRAAGVAPCDHAGADRYAWSDPTGRRHLACLDCGEVLCA